MFRLHHGKPYSHPIRGVTSDLEQRVRQHKGHVFDGFTKKYNVTHLVWFMAFPDMDQAIEAEKKIKGLLRRKKIKLIEGMNPLWDDLAEEWFERNTQATKILQS